MCEDADLDAAAQRIAWGAAAYAGQVCISVQRVFVHASVRTQFEAKLAAAMRTLPVGAARDGLALFPDAPTERGVRHVRLLSRLSRRQRCALVLCAQRSDVRAIAPDAAIDPDFARALRAAARKGVIVCGVRCSATLAGLTPLSEIPVLL